MKISVFPKMLGGITSGSEQARFLKSCGFEYSDLLIRKNYAVDENSDKEDINKVISEYRAEGIEILSAITDLNEADERMEKILSILGENNIGSIKIGLYRYQKGKFHETFKAARKKVEALAKLAEKYKVTILIQNHGGTINSSASTSRRLVDGLDSGNVAIYWDPGNMIRMDGHEAWPMSLEIIGPYLAYVGVKNAAWQKIDGKWRNDFCRLRDGIIQWPGVIKELEDFGYKGDFSLHSFYVKEGSIYDPETKTAITDDFNYLKECLNV